jgi:hypothetical protein
VEIGISLFTQPQPGRVLLALAAVNVAGAVKWYSSFLQVAGVQVE